MGGLKTFRTLVLALILPAAAPACAGEPLEMLRVFADCTGRYTAVTEHLWLFDGAASEDTAARRNQFADLVEAVAPDADVPASTILGWRIAARAA